MSSFSCLVLVVACVAATTAMGEEGANFQVTCEGNFAIQPPEGGSIEVPAKLLIANTSSAGDSTAATIDVAEQMNKMVEQMAAIHSEMVGQKGDLLAANVKIAGLADENAELKTVNIAMKEDHTALKTRVDDLKAAATAAAKNSTGVSEGVTDLNSSIANGPSPSSYCQNYFGDSSDGIGIFNEDTQFPSAEDGDMVVKQFSYLRISSLATLTTSKRCKGLLIYVDGDMDVYGELTMTARGAAVDPKAAGVPSSGLFYPACTAFDGPDDPHVPADALNVSADLSGCGAAAEAVAEKQSNLLRSSGVTSYRIAREGADGATARCAGPSPSCAAYNKPAIPGPQATDADLGLKSGGGGSGGLYSSNACQYRTCLSGGGGAGTCFSGGAGGAGKKLWGSHQSGYAALNLQERPGSPNGGAGGTGFGSGGSSGGAGNPGGAGTGSSDAGKYGGESGTGGLLMIIVRGQLTIYPGGAITSKGAAGGANCVSCTAHGGGSGGGNILILTGEGVAMQAGLRSNSLWYGPTAAYAFSSPLSVRGGASKYASDVREGRGKSWGGDGSIKIGRIDPNLKNGGSSGGITEGMDQILAEFAALKDENKMLKDELEVVRNSTAIGSDVVEQADGTFLAGSSLCAMLEFLALGDPAKPCVLPIELNEVVITATDDGNAAWVHWAPLLIAVKKVKGEITISEQRGLKSLAGLLPRLEEVGSSLTIHNNFALASIDGAFPSLRKVGSSITIRSNANLESLAGGFPALTSVASSVSLNDNDKLESVGAGDNQVFASMAPKSVKSLSFYNNMRYTSQQALCQSAKGTFCGLGASYHNTAGTYDALKCCQ